MFICDLAVSGFIINQNKVREGERKGERTFATKKPRNVFPDKALVLGISPICSIISTMWSSSLLYRDPDTGSNSCLLSARTRFSSMSATRVGGYGGKLTTQATLPTSALAPHFAPSMTSGQRYCRVWISSVKWCCVRFLDNFHSPCFVNVTTNGVVVHAPSAFSVVPDRCECLGIKKQQA
jgi:hypothetical protein